MQHLGMCPPWNSRKLPAAFPVRAEADRWPCAVVGKFTAVVEPGATCRQTRVHPVPGKSFGWAVAGGVAGGGLVGSVSGGLSKGLHGHGSCFLQELGQRLREKAMRGSTGRAAGPEVAGTATGALPGRPARAGLAASAAALMGSF